MSNADLLGSNSEIQLYDDSEIVDVEPIQFDVALNFPEVNRLAVGEWTRREVGRSMLKVL